MQKPPSARSYDSIRQGSLAGSQAIVPSITVRVECTGCRQADTSNTSIESLTQVEALTTIARPKAGKPTLPSGC